MNDIELRYLMATEGAQVGLWDWNIKTGEVHFNEQWYTLLGFTPYELPESFETFEELCHPDDLRAVLDALQRHFDDDQQAYKINLRMRHKQGGWVWIYTTGKVMERDSEGKPVRAFGIHIDVTEQVDAERALVRANRKLEQFAFMASHDMKAPLRTISMALGVLQKQSPDIAEGDNKKTFDFITHAVEDLQIMLEDLLSFARSDVQSVHEEQFCSEGAVEDVLQMTSASIEEANAHITIEDLPVITCNKARFSRIVQNLVSNAIKFHGPNEKPDISIRCSEEPECWIFSLRDKGIGISEESLEVIFEPYSRLHEDQKIEGLGLGLNIVRQFASDLGGDAWAESSEGQGSEFFFSIPKPEK